MRTIAQTIEALKQPGVPGDATVRLDWMGGVCGQAKLTTITLRELQELAACAAGFIELNTFVAGELDSQSTEIQRARSDDRRESDRHPPMPV